MSKWALGANRHLGERGTPSTYKCPVPIFSKCLQMGTGTNEHLQERGTTSALKEYPQVPSAHFLKMFSNEHWDKWALGANGHLGVRDTPSALCPFSQMFANGHWRQMDIWGKEAPQVSCTHFPEIFSQVPIFPTAHLKKFGENGHRALVISR